MRSENPEDAMRAETGRAVAGEDDSDFRGGGLFADYMEHVSSAFAVTSGVTHTLVYANAAFRRAATAVAGAALGRPLGETVTGRSPDGLISVLDRAFRGGVTVRDRRFTFVDEPASPWCCTVWPQTTSSGDTVRLVIELRMTRGAEQTFALQRDVAERMLLSVLRETAIASDAEALSARATFLAVEGQRLAESLDEHTTLHTMARLSLPIRAVWCIVDTLDDDGKMHRLAMVHPNPEKQALLRGLEGRWSPELGDPFGAPALLQSTQPIVIDRDIDTTVTAAAHDPATLRTLREVGVGPLLTVPLVIRKQLVGAITFVSPQHDRGFAPEDVDLAEHLASRSAMALDSARIHGAAIAHKAAAESASKAKTAFLGTMSHELRTPLNAIGGYVDLIDLGLRGPVTAAQHADLARIRANQQHLIGLVTDVLNFVRLGGGHAVYATTDVVASEVLAASVALVEPLMAQKQLIYGGAVCDASVVARADFEKLTQILVNLMSNAIKFTPAGGRIVASCEAMGQAVVIRVADTGIGIAAEKLEVIFEPFVQIAGGLTRREGGVGLGLAISRNLARGMSGDLTVVSGLGVGSTFTLSLPRATPPASS